MKKISFTLLLVLIFSCSKQRNIQALEFFERKYKFDFEIEDKLQKDTIAWKHQLSANEYMLKGNYEKAMLEFDKAFGGRNIEYSKQEIDSIKNTYKVFNAKDEILNEAQKTSIIVINEAHQNSYHRLFTKSLLKDLHKQGYRYLGLEALVNSNSRDFLLNSRNYPVKKSGYYINDPNFSSLIREAIKIGYIVFPYEQNTGVNFKEREIAQAKNIKTFMDKHPNGKFLIHCGFDHVLEGDYGGRWEKSMTERLKSLTNTNPLTINQTKFSERGNKAFNHPILKALNITEPSVLKDKSDKVYPYKRNKTWTDIAVFHPKIKTENGNIIKENDIEFNLDLSDVELQYPLMILAFNENDIIEKAVPILVNEVYNDEKEIKLFLPKGNYNFVVVNKDNQAIKFKETIQ